jgi:hypothetical protein
MSALIVVQFIGGLFYLLNKIFLSFAERAELKRPNDTFWRALSWVVYLIGLPAWVMIFIWKDDTIAAALEASGAPGMVLGLMLVFRKKGEQQIPWKAELDRWLDRLAYAVMGVGFGYSLRMFGGLTTLHQWLELGIVIGFLAGIGLLAHKNRLGYVCYLVMCICNAELMREQGFNGLFWQQVLSIGFIIDAYVMSRQRAT